MRLTCERRVPSFAYRTVLYSFGQLGQLHHVSSIMLFSTRLDLSEAVHVHS